MVNIAYCPRLNHPCGFILPWVASLLLNERGEKENVTVPKARSEGSTLTPILCTIHECQIMRNISLSLCLFFSFLAHAQTANVATNAPACPFFTRYTDNQDGTVTNPRTGLMWKHCAEGASWDGSRCSNTGTPMNWVEAMQSAKASQFAGHSNWRLPTIAELESTKAHFCESDMLKVVGKAPVETMIQWSFWSSSPWKHPKKPTDDDVGAASVISFWGLSWGLDRFVNVPVRLVRGSRPGDTSREEFDAEYAKLNQYQKMADEQNQRYQGSATERKKFRERFRAYMDRFGLDP